MEAFGSFHRTQGHVLSCFRYHGNQFGIYNASLGDGRGFLYGQLWNEGKVLVDLTTKGSGTTPYSRGLDGRLSLEGGIREALIGEALHKLGVPTARVLCLIATSDSLEREGERTRGVVLTRIGGTILRVGSLQALAYEGRRDAIMLIIKYMLRYVYNDHEEGEGVESGCGHDKNKDDNDKDGNSEAREECIIRFSKEFTHRLSKLGASWTSVGFVHGVLNTDNIALSGQGIDYGPSKFIPMLDPSFVAASFDKDGFYSFGKQPCALLSAVVACQDAIISAAYPSAPPSNDEGEEAHGHIHSEKLHEILASHVAGFMPQYETELGALTAQRLGIERGAQSTLDPVLLAQLGKSTLSILQSGCVEHQDFYSTVLKNLAGGAALKWLVLCPEDILKDASFSESLEGLAEAAWREWRRDYHAVLNALDMSALHVMQVFAATVEVPAPPCGDGLSLLVAKAVAGYGATPHREE